MIIAPQEGWNVDWPAQFLGWVIIIVLWRWLKRAPQDSLYVTAATFFWGFLVLAGIDSLVALKRGGWPGDAPIVNVVYTLVWIPVAVWALPAFVRWLHSWWNESLDEGPACYCHPCYGDDHAPVCDFYSDREDS